MTPDNDLEQWTKRWLKSWLEYKLKQWELDYTVDQINRQLREDDGQEA